LQGEREYGADVMQLLYIANRYERKPDLQRWLDGGLVLVCDRYAASSIAYGEALGLDAIWLADIQRFLPQPPPTILLHLTPATRPRKLRGSARHSIATATSATSRCRSASARATIARRPPIDGSCSMASGPRTPSPRTSSRRPRK